MEQTGTWHKTTYSDGRGGNCVEVSEGATTLVRDSQNPDARRLEVPRAEWSVLLDTVRP